MQYDRTIPVCPSLRQLRVNAVPPQPVATGEDGRGLARVQKRPWRRPLLSVPVGRREFCGEALIWISSLTIFNIRLLYPNQIIIIIKNNIKTL